MDTPQKSVISRLMEGERIFVPGGSNDSGSVTTMGVGHWYGKVRKAGKYLHTAKVKGGIEMWTDDTPAELRAAKPASHRRRYQTAD